MKKHTVILFFAGLCLLAAACNYDRFTLNKSGFHLIEGYKMCHFDSVEVVADNALYLKENSRVSLRSLTVADLHADFTAELLDGEGVKLYFRTARIGFETHPHIMLEYTRNGSTIYENGVVVAQSPVSAAYDKIVRIKLRNDGTIVKILIDCDVVYYGRTMLPASEYVIIEPLPKSRVLLTGIDFAKILEVDEY